MDNRDITAWIYGLIDPRDGEIHYIGWSTRPEMRLREHIKCNKGTCKGVWIKELREDGLEPSMKFLEVTNLYDVQSIEQGWIEEGRKLGWPLTNMVFNGKGGRPRGDMGRLPIGGGPLVDVLASVRCSDETRGRLEHIADQLDLKISELIRAYVHFCTLRQPNASVRTLVKASRNVSED